MSPLIEAVQIPRDIVLMLVGFVIGFGAAAMSYAINSMDE